MDYSPQPLHANLVNPRWTQFHYPSPFIQYSTDSHRHPSPQIRPILLDPLVLPWRIVGDVNLPKPYILTFAVQSGDTLTAATDGLIDPIGPDDANNCINPNMSTEDSAIEILHATQQAGFRFKSDDRWVIIQKIMSQ